MIKQHLSDIFTLHKLNFSFRSDDPLLWDTVWENLDYQAVVHDDKSTSYHRSYFSSNKVNVQELSVVFFVMTVLPLQDYR